MIQHDEYVTPKVIQWIDVFDDLKKAGQCQSAICQLIGVPWSTALRWSSGECEPKHSIGVALLLIHERYCGRPLTIERELEAVDLSQLRPKITIA